MPPERGALRDFFAQNITVVAAMSAVSAVMYAISGKLNFGGSLIYLLPAAAGGICGALLLDRIDTFILKLIFAAVTIYGGIRMLFG